MVGDGSFLMMASEIVTAIQEGYKLNIVLLDNHGFGSIGALSQSLGSSGFGTEYRYREPRTGQLNGEYLPVDFVNLAEGMGARAVRADTRADLERALRAMREQDQTTVVVVEVDKWESVPGYESWWDVPLSEVSQIESIRLAREGYDEALKKERRYEPAPMEKIKG
jgi:3D-(3,5/4)-trihydroxycyclohexane-1,2-dione acylhydrolase (decyclizing)